MSQVANAGAAGAVAAAAGAGASGGAAGGAGGAAGGGAAGATGRTFTDEQVKAYERADAIAKAAERLGIRDADGFKPFEAIHGLRSSGKLTDAMLAALGGSGATAKDDKATGATAKSYEEAVAAAKLELAEERALADHDKASGALPDFISGQLVELFGADRDTELDELLGAALYGRLHQDRAAALRDKDETKHAGYRYPEGHPLRESRLAPFSKENAVGSTKWLTDSQKKLLGKLLKKVGDAGARGGTSTPGGDRAAQGGAAKGEEEDPVTKAAAAAVARAEKHLKLA